MSPKNGEGERAKEPKEGVKLSTIHEQREKPAMTHSANVTTFCFFYNFSVLVAEKIHKSQRICLCLLLLSFEISTTYTLYGGN